MQINPHTALHAQASYAHSAPANSARHVRSTDDWHPIDRARHTFRERAEEDYLEGSLSKKGLALADAAVAPGKIGAPGVQVSTFAVGGAQANDIVLIKRVPATEQGPNFLLYVPAEEEPSFHAFKTQEELTVWVKEQAGDPQTRDAFAAHFAQAAVPNREARVKDTLTRFADNDINAVVGRYGYERGDIFTRLNKDDTQPPVPVNGLSNTHFFGFDRQGSPTYKGYMANGKEMIYKYDAYGNLHGASDKNTFYFVRNGLNNREPLVPMTLQQYTRTVTSVSLDNSGANDLAGMFHEFVKQLRNPGEGIAMALIAFGVPQDVAYSIEEILKNPVKGTLLQLNHDNRLGRLFGVGKETADKWLEQVGGELQSRLPRYGTARDILNTVADTLEQYGPPAPDTATTVMAR